MEEHPNIDSLRAFVADTLVEEERRRVLVHLIQCEACRGQLALLTPEEGPPPPAVLKSRRDEPKPNGPGSRKRFKKWFQA
jgi:hypothetical protein